VWQGRAVLVGKNAVTLVGLAKTAAGRPPRLAVRLLFSAAEYDPSQPSPATLRCVVRNDGKQAVQVPVGYDGRAVVVHSGLLTLQPAPGSKGQEGGKGRDGVDLVRLEPGQEQVVFDLPLDSIFRVSDPPDGAWSWDWPRCPEPPRSPIHQYRRPGFLARARFTASLALEGQTVNSNEAVLKVKSGR
jgi:hypothetical protein